LLIDLEKVNNESNLGSVNADSWELDFLAEYIINVHHKYVREHLPSLQAWSEKVAKVHGEHSPETIRIAELVSEIASELSSHMVKEEQILFPAIVGMVKASKGDGIPGFTRIEAPIQVMEHEHESVGNLFKEIEVLSNNFTPPAHACNTFRALYDLLQEFENDLFLHIHLENNILFPKAIVLRDQLGAE
jgi:regulator of cell morphogenesis and NO signaling